MDMDTSHNWLSFSLSHYQPCNTFLDSFSSTPQLHQVADEEARAATELASLSAMAPKFEDFLGGSKSYNSEDLGSCTTAIYDSELKSITAGLVQGHAAEQHDPTESGKEVVPAGEARKTVDNFGQRTSIYRGVTRHRWTGRYEAHLWDNSCRREGQSRKGRQVYLGGYDKEEKAARAYDLAALKYWGPTTTTNFPISNYETELEEMKNMTRQEFVASLRRKSSGFSRGASIYRGVTRHHQHGRWQARIGRVAGNKDLYLGTFSTQEEAAEAYDIAAIKFRGLNAVTNFDVSRYDVQSIANNTLPIGNMSCRATKAPEASPASPSETTSIEAKQQHIDPSASLGFSNVPTKQEQEYWSLLALQQQQQQNGNQELGFGLFSCGVNMDFSTCNASNNGASNLVWNNGMLEQSHGNDIGSQYATPSTYNYNYSEGSNMNYTGTWVANAMPSSSSYYEQGGKPNVAAFQRAIFGIE